jgi:hypothetical protein
LCVAQFCATLHCFLIEDFPLQRQQCRVRSGLHCLGQAGLMAFGGFALRGNAWR